jgi:hypothetical protein
MATTVQYGNVFTTPVVIRPLTVKEEDLKKKGVFLDKTRTTVNLEAGIYLFEFPRTNLPVIPRKISGTGTLTVDAVIPS